MFSLLHLDTKMWMEITNLCEALVLFNDYLELAICLCYLVLSDQI